MKKSEKHAWIGCIITLIGLVLSLVIFFLGGTSNAALIISIPFLMGIMFVGLELVLHEWLHPCEK